MNKQHPLLYKSLVIGIMICFMLLSPLAIAITKERINHPPYEPSNPIPPDGAENWTGGGLCWTGGDPDSDLVTYDVYFGKSNPPPQIEYNISGNCTDPYSNPEFNTTYFWKIVAWDEHGASTEGPIWSFTTRGNSPPLPPLMWTEDFTTFNILIVDPDGDGILILIDWGDGTHEDWSGPYESGEIVSISHVWPPGTYQIKLKARDYWDGESKEAVYGGTVSSDFKFFHVSIGYVDLTYKFTIYLEDYEKYLFDWGDGTYSDWVTGIADKSFSYPGEYEIRWKAKDMYGSETKWSDPTLITILTLGNNPPSTPIIDGPTSGKIGVEYTYTFNSTDYDGDSFIYYVDWGDGSPIEIVYPTWPNPEEPGEGKANHSWDTKGTYIIRAKAKDIYGAQSDWGILIVTMRRNRATIYSLFQLFLDRFPLLEVFLRAMNLLR